VADHHNTREMHMTTTTLLLSIFSVIAVSKCTDLLQFRVTVHGLQLVLTFTDLSLKICQSTSFRMIVIRSHNIINRTTTDYSWHILQANIIASSQLHLFITQKYNVDVY